MIINILIGLIYAFIGYEVGHSFGYTDGIFDANINHYDDIKDNT